MLGTGVILEVQRHAEGYGGILGVVAMKFTSQGHSLSFSLEGENSEADCFLKTL